jgi:uncharacterized membrane protein YfcA
MGGGSVERRVRAVRGAEDAEITMGLLGFEIAARPMRDYPRPCPRVGRRTLPMPSLLAHGPLWLASLAVALLVTGAFTGFVAGMLGVGGGIVMVPFLLQLFAFLGVDESIRMHLVLGTSLASILPTAITSGRAHARRGAVDKLTLGHWAPSLLIGSALGTLVAGQARGSVLTIGFGVLATGIAIDLLRKRTDAVKASREQGNPERTRSRPWLQRVLALGVGGLSALLGVGGGAISVPLLIAFGHPTLRAVGTAGVFGVFVALPAAIGYAWTGWGNPLLPPGSVGYVHLLGVALLTPMTVLFAPIGVATAHRVSTVALRRIFAAFLLITAARMLAGLV